MQVADTAQGKSLSLICGALTWLRDHKRRTFEEGLSSYESNDNEPAWIVEQAKAQRRKALLRSRQEMELRLSSIRAKEKRERERFMKGEGRDAFKRRRVERDGHGKGGEGDGEEQFVLDEYESDEEGGGKQGAIVGGALPAGSGLSKETLALMEKLGMATGPPKEEEEEIGEEIKVIVPDFNVCKLAHPSQIFYCSRTHSQLTQFINELHRVKMPPALPSESESPTQPQDRFATHEEFKHLTLGSRKNLCINTNVAIPSRSTSAINERCLDLQQSSTPSGKRCGFLPNKDTQPLVTSFRDHALARPRDIEDLAELGKKLQICPYYASRAAIKPAEIVTLPYPLLLQQSAREALGIDVRGHVVIVDEAHNLMDAVAGIYGVEMGLRDVRGARAGLGIYLKKFGRRLAGKNRVYVAQVVRVVDSLIGCLEKRFEAKVCLSCWPGR